VVTGASVRVLLYRRAAAAWSSPAPAWSYSGGCPAAVPASILDDVRTAHDIIAMLPDDVHAEVIEGEVIVNAATPAGRHAKIVLAVRRAFARHGIDNLFENTTLLVEQDEAEYVPDLARWPEHLIDGETWEFPAAECAFALEVVSDDRPGRRQRDYQKAPGYARGGVPVFLLIDPLERTCTLSTEPKAGDYSVRQIVKFGESLLIPAGDSTVELSTGDL
jgi:hypothetical protein